MSSTMRNIGEYIKAVVGIAAQSTAAATVTGSAIDRATYGYPLSAKLVFNVGSAAGSPSSFTVTPAITHCATSGGSYVAYTDKSGNTPAVITAAGVGELNVDLSGAHEFLEISMVVAFVGGTSPTIPVSAEVIFGGMPELATDLT